MDTVIAMMEKPRLNVHAEDCMFTAIEVLDKPNLSAMVVKNYFAMNVTELIGGINGVVDFHIVLIVEMMPTIANNCNLKFDCVYTWARCMRIRIRR